MQRVPAVCAKRGGAAEGEEDRVRQGEQGAVQDECSITGRKTTLGFRGASRPELTWMRDCFHHTVAEREPPALRLEITVLPADRGGASGRDRTGAGPHRAGTAGAVRGDGMTLSEQISVDRVMRNTTKGA